MFKVPKTILPVLIATAIVGVVFIVSATRTHDSGGEVLGESDIPEGADIVVEPVQLPENVVKNGSLPVNQNRITNQESGTNESVIAEVVSTKEIQKQAGNEQSANKQQQPEVSNPNGKKIVIHLKTQTMDVVENGEVLHSFQISSGKRGMQTPTGTFTVLNKSPRAYSKTYGLYMPFWMAFTTRGHGIHELPEWPNGYKEGENHLGTPVSHGCVRLGVGSAKTVYDWAEVGTVVEVVQD